jgi:hypothetical protein
MSVTIIAPPEAITISNTAFQRILALAAISTLDPKFKMDATLPTPSKRLAAVLQRLSALTGLDTLIDADARVFTVAMRRATRMCLGFRRAHLQLQNQTGITEPIEAVPFDLDVPEADIIMAIMSGPVLVSTAATYAYLTATAEQLSLLLDIKEKIKGPAITLCTAK